MRYPSEVLGELAEKMDVWEDEAFDRYAAAKGWLAGWKVWEWREQAQRIQELKEKNQMLVREFKKLQDRYREETGKPPPGNLVVVLADTEGLQKAMAAFRRAVAELAVNLSRRRVG